MSEHKKAEKFADALILLLKCRDFIQKSYWSTPGRSILLMEIESFEKKLVEDFTQKEK